MPSIDRLELKGGLHTRFARIKTVLLPQEISTDKNAQWVMRFDSLLQERTERTSDRQRYDDDFSSSRYQREEWSRQAAGYFTASLLQSRIPFYFASLFHIGRQIKVSEAALRDCRTLQEGNNLYDSAANLIEEADRQNEDRVEKAPEIEATMQAIMGICEAAISQHERNITMARNWWRIWQTEVEEYRRLVGQIEEHASSNQNRHSRTWLQPAMRMMLISSQPSILQSNMMQQGVRFKDQTTTSSNLSIQSIPPAMLLFGIFPMAMWASFEDDGSHSMRHMEHVFDEYIRELKMARLAPGLNAAWDLLREKYGINDPFAPYALGKSPPTPELLQLIKEHNLPNNEDSIWLSVWRKGFLTQNAGSFPLPFEADISPNLLEWGFASADSTIKYFLTNTRYFVETWDDFLQRLFEANWILMVGGAMVLWNQKTKDTEQRWTDVTFYQFVSNVVAHLNIIGYRLTAPSKQRLFKLLLKLTAGNKVLNNEGW